MLNSLVFHVCLEGLEFYGHHGVHPEERATGHRYAVDLRLAVAGSADSTDRLEDTVDYGEAAAVVLAASEEGQYSTLEALGGAIADRMLERFALVNEVRVRVAKLLPPIPQVAKSAAVEITASRDAAWQPLP